MFVKMVPGLNVTSDCAMPCMPGAGDSKIAYVMNQQHPQVDDPFDYVDFVNEQKAFRQAYRNCPITELPIHAVQTGREVLFFSNSPLGLQGLKQFYQELVNGYFSVHSERDPVCEYSVS